MRPFLVIWLTICLASLASAFQQPTNPGATVPKPPDGVSAPYDCKAERQLLDLANQARAVAPSAPEVHRVSCVLSITGRIYSIPTTTWPALPSSATEARFT